MTALGQDLAAVISPPRIGADGFWVADPTPEQAARLWMHEMNRRSLEREREAATKLSPVPAAGVPAE